MCCGIVVSQSGAAAMAAARVTNNMITIEYLGTESAVMIRGANSQRNYQFGALPHLQTASVDESDVSAILALPEYALYEAADEADLRERGVIAADAVVKIGVLKAKNAALYEAAYGVQVVVSPTKGKK